jgi:hypothetical protein
MKIRIIKESKNIKEQQGKPAVLMVGGFELMGQARADVRLVDSASKIVHSVGKTGKDLATVQQLAIQEITKWAAANGYTITKTVKDPA